MKTDGFLVSLLKRAAKDSDHESHHEASKLLPLFRAMETKFFETVHRDTDTGLAMAEVQAAEGNTPNVFTRHDGGHVRDLIVSIDKLAESIAEKRGHDDLGIEDAYVLLCAAHVHDAPNKDGRHNHPRRCAALIEGKKDLFADSARMQYIAHVASAHGGEHKQYGPDTISELAMNGDSYTPPRLPLLAAILRLADELSDNPQRVPEGLVEDRDVAERSELAFAYARSFTRFELRKDTLKIVFSLYPRDLQTTAPQLGLSFMDHLEERIDKLERESRYCSQYGRPALNVAQIDIVLNQYDSGPPGNPVGPPVPFSLYLDRGYPDSVDDLCTRSPELKQLNLTSLADVLTPLFTPSHSPAGVVPDPEDSDSQAPGADAPAEADE